MRPTLTLLKVPVTAEQLAKLFEKITGRKPTEQEMDEIRRMLAKAMHVAALSIMLASTAQG